jgi:CubicO group peptidase (beta-lactamase class C family)
MRLKRLSRCLRMWALVACQISLPAAATLRAQGAAEASTATGLAQRLASLEKELEAKRQELGVPGLSLVIVKDDEVIFMKGLGYKDVERKLPVTPDTLFAIGSASKAFTGMTAAMSADDGKLSLDDSPKKYLPYFKLQDAEADRKITVRDLLTHSSGLNRTDLGWASGAFTREEVIKIAGEAKPAAKFREKFLYQNVMYAAAGEVVAKAQGKAWERVVAERIFKPLGMKSTNLAIQDMQRARDYALGYSYIKSTKETKRLPMREITHIAPAGSINSSAREMAAWVRLMLGGGVFEGKRLVSERGFAELIKPQMKITDKVHYGLGWFVREREGQKVYDHGGNIDGFSSMVAFAPGEKLGFAYLSNANGSPLASAVRDIVWKHLAGKPAGGTAEAEAGGEMKVEPQSEAGVYRLAEANLNIEFMFGDGRLTAKVPGQPNYPLENVVGRRYKLGAPAPDGFFVTFRPVKDKAGETEAYLEQPHGNYVLTRLKGAEQAKAEEQKGEEKKGEAAAAESYSGPMKDLLGQYQSDQGGPTVEIKLSEGQVALVVPAQPAYPLKEVERDVYGATNLPATYRVTVRRDEAGKVNGLLLKQPEGEFAFKRVAESKVEITADELMAKVIAAMGGEENLRRHKTMTLAAEVDFESQGVKGEVVSYAKAPNLSASEITFVALGRRFATAYEYFDGEGGGEGGSFMPAERYAGKNLEDKRVAADFHQALNWKTHYKTVEVTRRAKVGDEDVYVVVKTPEKGNPVTDYVSAKTFLVVKRDLLNTTNAGEMTLPSTETYSDFRTVDGVVLPFKTVQSSLSMGDTVVRVKEVKFDAEVPEKAFRARAK